MKVVLCGFAENGVIHFKTLGNQGRSRVGGTAQVIPDSLIELGERL